MTTVQQLVTNVVEDGNFDVSSARALEWLNQRQRKMVTRAKSYRKSVELGPTVAGQAEYALPLGVVEIYEVTVNGTLLGQINHDDLTGLAQGYSLLTGTHTAFAPAEDAGGASGISVWPVPTEAGQAVVMRACWIPGDLVIGDESTLVIPQDFCDQLVSGALATGLARSEQRQDLAAGFEQDFSAGCEELRRQVSKKYRGAGPAQIRVPVRPGFARRR